MRSFLILLFLFPFYILAQGNKKVDLSNPNATIHTHIYFLQNNSYNPEKSAQTIQGVSKEEAKEIAIKIKTILDGKGLMLDFRNIPKDSSYQDTVYYQAEYKYALFPDKMPLIYVEKKGENWYYSKETVDNIDILYEDIFPWYIEKVQELIPGAGHKEVFGIQIWQYVVILLLLITSFLVYIIARRIIFFLLIKVFHKYVVAGRVEVKESLRKQAHPISLLIALWLIGRVFPSLHFSLEVNSWAFLAFDMIGTIFWIYVFLKLASVIASVYQNYAESTHGKLDDQLVPIIKNFLTGIVIIGGVFKLLTISGIDPTTILAGASIGGLAIAFASQDTVKNLIGTVMIFVDKPFHIGDWITAGEVVGTVEEVGFRSTRIRAADTTIFQIPNSKLSELVINNAGLRLYRRYNTQLGIRYDTPPDLIEAFVKGVRGLIEAHPDTRSEAYNVEFVGFGDSALLIMMNMYLKDLAWSNEQSSKHQIHMAIVKLAKELGVDFAFPSTTIMIEQFPEKKSFDMLYNTDEKRLNQVIETAVEDFKKSTEKSDFE